MRYFLLASSLLFLHVFHAQLAPIDFEENGFGAAWTWTVFENQSNPPLEIISNPASDEVNSSATVAQFTALQAGAPFAGCETLHGADIGSFDFNASNSTVTIMVWKSVISDVGIKLVRFDNWSLGEIKIANTLVNQWEKMTFDLSSLEGQTYDQIVIFPDFDLDGRVQDNVIYFDNIEFGDGTVSVDESASVETFSIFPNPSTGIIQLNSATALQTVNVFGADGKEVYSAQELDALTQLDLSFLPKGFYSLVCTSKSGRRVIRLVIE